MTYAERVRVAYLEWVKVVITVVTPSIVLLIGLQDISSINTLYLKSSLLASIASMGLAILSGLIIIKSKYHGYKMLHESEMRRDIQDQKLPWFYRWCFSVFEWATPIGIIALVVFGFIKYI